MSRSVVIAHRALWTVPLLDLPGRPLLRQNQSFLMCGMFALNIGQLRAVFRRTSVPLNSIALQITAPVVAGDSIELLTCGIAGW
jgi:hypothetical protein